MEIAYRRDTTSQNELIIYNNKWVDPGLPVCVGVGTGGTEGAIAPPAAIKGGGERFIPPPHYWLGLSFSQSYISLHVLPITIEHPHSTINNISVN